MNRLNKRNKTHNGCYSSGDGYRSMNDGYIDVYEKYPAIFSTPVAGTQYTINVSQVFGDAYTFDEAIHILNIAQEEDIVSLIINSEGGNYYSLVSLKNAVRSSKATIEMHLLGMAASAGSALFLERADSYHIGKDSCMMIHNMISGTGYDDTVKTVERALFNQKINKRFVEETYKYFLTDKEIEDVILNGKEIWLEDHEIKSRLKEREKILGEQLKNVGQLHDVDLSQINDEDLHSMQEACIEDLESIESEFKSRGL